MITKSQKMLVKYVGKKWSYRIVFTTYIIMVMTPIILFGWLFNYIPFIIISTITVNSIRSYSFGFHTSNGKCTLLTYCLLIAFGYISKTIQIEWSLIFALLSMRYIYIKAPLKLTHKGKSKQFHRDRIQLLMMVYFIASLVFLYFGMNYISNCILCSLGLVGLTSFENVDES